MNHKWRILGEKLISDHSRVVTGSDPSVLTGPMFSHLIGNLVLSDLDNYFSTHLPARYFRYVDDITLVGSVEAVRQSLEEVRIRLADLGFAIHDDGTPKSLEIATTEWIAGREDYRQSKREISWMTLIGDLKRFLLLNAEAHQHLKGAFKAEGFRIPVRDYSSSVYERSYLENIRRWTRSGWFRRKLRTVSVQTLLNQAQWLRNSYEIEFQELADGFDNLSAYEQKRRIPKLRYRAGRLCYLAADDRLREMAAMASALPELHLQSAVMETTATGRIDRILSLGSSAAQAAAQPMRAGGKHATMVLSDLGPVQQQALAVFRLNGVEVKSQQMRPILDSEILEFAEQGGTRRVMNSADLFIRERVRPRHDVPSRSIL